MKRKTAIFLILVTILSNGISAQNPETDSLKRLVAGAKEDHSQVMNLESLSYSYLSSFPDSALQYATKGLLLAQKIGDKAGETSCIIAMGNVFFHIGDFAKALDLYLQALKMKEAMKNQSIAVVCFNISNVYIEQKDFDHALIYLFKAMQDDRQRKDSAGILFDYYALGALHQKMKKPDSALFYTRQAFELSNRLEEQDLRGAILNNFASIYTDQNQHTRALSYYHASIAASARVNDLEVLAENYFGLAKVYRETAQMDSSVYYAYKALEIAQAAPYLKQVVDASLFLSGLFEKERQWDSAYKYFTLSTRMKDSLYNVDEVKKIQTLKFTEQQRQQAIATAERESRQRVTLYIVVGTAILFLTIAVLLWRSNKQKQKAYLLLQHQKQKTERALQELKTMQAQLIQSEKMASLGELTAGIAHEIQNPLNFVNNFSEACVELSQELKEAIEKTLLPPTQKQTLLQTADEMIQSQEKIIFHGRRADAIVKSMLQHSGRSDGVKVPTDINRLVDEYLRLSYHGFRSREKTFSVNLTTDFDSGIGKVDVTPQDIGRVLLNLFSNAFYAVGEKKKQLNSPYQLEVSVKTERVNNNVRICIKDNGTGIPESAVNKIFQPFFTTKPTGEGTGLGLSLSYDIITKGHDGELSVQSKEGKGSEFIISLPVKSVVTDQPTV